MKLIVAVIRPERLEAVQNALNERDVYLMTVSDVRGCGRQRGYTEVYRGTEYQVRLLPKLKLEIAVNDVFVEATIEAIVHAARMGETGQIVIRQKTVFPKLAKVFADSPVEILQAWAAFHLLDQTAPYLSKRFVEARFEFRNRKLAGQIEEQQRWKRATQLVNSSLGEAVGKEYVARHFPPESRATMEGLVRLLKAALQNRIERLEWMTPETKAKALEKLSMFGVKIGYPNKWRDYSALETDVGDLLGNVRRANEFRWAYAV